MPIQPPYESTFAYLRLPSSSGGMEAYYDALRLFVALLQNEDGLPVEHLAELAYHLSDEQRRQLQQLAAAAGRLNDAAIAAEIGEEQYLAQTARRFGAHNPERMDVPFWTFMVRRRWSAHQARMQFDAAYRRGIDEARARYEREQAGETTDREAGAESEEGAACFRSDSPVWCFDRFGMSLTRLPDGRALFIAGEHEDFYDPDFCIYNDVIAIAPDLQATIYGYPEEVFPPTDFHTATLAGPSDLYLIGNLGYLEARRPGETPVYRLDTTTMQIAALSTSGDGPGWIAGHAAEYVPARGAIKVTGGRIFTGRGGKHALKANRRTWWLDLATMAWSRRRP